MGQDLLTPNQRRLLERAAGDHVITDAYYLTGGTALMAFYLGHRISEDLDFFTETPIDHTIIADWAKQTKRLLAQMYHSRRCAASISIIFIFHRTSSK